MTAEFKGTTQEQGQGGMNGKIISKQIIKQRANDRRIQEYKKEESNNRKE